MNRRQWIKSSTAITGSICLSALPFNELFSIPETNNGIEKKDAIADIKEVHIVNLSHHDYGYTDLPSSVWDYQVNNIRRAMQFIEETKNYPAEARFRWTEEGLWGLERFWQQASENEKKHLEKLVADGMFEVTAMPGNMTCLVDKYEWEKELDRLSFFYKKFKPKVALQDDVNGLPWGMVDSLLNRSTLYNNVSQWIYGRPASSQAFIFLVGRSKQQ